MEEDLLDIRHHGFDTAHGVISARKFKVRKIRQKCVDLLFTAFGEGFA